MNISFENLSPYEADMRRRVVELEFERACFLARPSVMLGIVPFKDGDQWCTLYGANLQEGICGFGDTPDAAMQEFDKGWRGQPTEKEK